MCGDIFDERMPRSHELGGKYGQGVIVKTYPANGQIYVNTQVTANHKGHFYFQICNLDRNGGVESEACFAQNTLKLTNGAGIYVLPSSVAGWFDLTLQIPSGLTCEHCVLRWNYVAANRWGICPDGNGALGCGAQEYFRACSDIRIR